eukprot:1260236-Pyramimonas_sp.AAC.1
MNRGTSTFTCKGMRSGTPFSHLMWLLSGRPALFGARSAWRRTSNHCLLWLAQPVSLALQTTKALRHQE